MKLVKWTDDIIAALARLCATTTMSGSQLADHFGTTRNAIIGKCRRAGIALPFSSDSPLAVQQRAGRADRLHKQKMVRFRFKERNPPALALPAVDAPTPLNLTLLELEDRQCRQPFGEEQYVFCGHPTRPGSSYCPYHAAQNEYLAEPKPTKYYLRLSGRAA